MLRRTLKLEKTIIKQRVAGLKEYNDVYSTILDRVAAEQVNLKDNLTKIAKEGKKVEETTKKLKSANTKSNNNENSSSNNSEHSSQSKSVKRIVSSTKKQAAEKPNRAQKKDKKFADQFIIEKGNITSSADIKAWQNKDKQNQYEANLEAVKQINENEAKLRAIKYQDAETKELKLTELRLANINKIQEAEIANQNLTNSINTQIEYETKHPLEAGETRVKLAQAVKEQEIIQELQAERAARIAELELQYRLDNEGKYDKRAAASITKIANEEYKQKIKNLEKLTSERFKKEAIQAKKQADEKAKQAAKAKGQEIKSSADGIFKKGATWEERKQSFNDFKDQVTDEETGKANKKAIALVAAKLVSDFAKQLENEIDEIANKQGRVDTRLHGSSNKQSNGSYWDQIVKDITGVGAVNPFFKQKDYASKIEDLVDRGIAFNIEQRAFLATIKDKIATTFDAADSTLLRLIRIQQEDSTAGRLGMEVALNAFLNNMYENTEYLKMVAASVRSSLEEMQSLMQGAEAAEVEYQVQKWLGSLYSVGMSQTAVQGISDTFGKIAAGQIEGLTGGGTSNLLIMAASEAGIPITDILTHGINAEDTNKLLQAVVNYLADLSDSAKDNRVIQQQLANVFGIKASDLRAATNLALPGSVNNISKNSLTYEGMLGQLMSMAGSMGSRTSLAEAMSNIWANGQYTLSGSIASSPIAYFIYKMAKMLDDVAGGIDLPFINVMGFGVDLNTTVSDLMRVASMGAGILGSIGPIIDGLGSSFSGQAMLNKLGINATSGLTATPRGGGSIKDSTGKTITESGVVAGNSSGSDIKDSTLQDADNSKKQQMIEAKEEAEANQVDMLNTTVLKIYELLDNVANGKNSFKVKVEGYGLTSTTGSASKALGGVDSLLSSSSSFSSSDSSSGSSLQSIGGSLGNNQSAGANSGSSSGAAIGSVSFGGWTTT